jgi:hypothetical protein
VISHEVTSADPLAAGIPLTLTAYRMSPVQARAAGRRPGAQEVTIFGKSGPISKRAGGKWADIDGSIGTLEEDNPRAD